MFLYFMGNVVEILFKGSWKNGYPRGKFILAHSSEPDVLSGKKDFYEGGEP